jgi:hypothetical protein
LNPKNENDGTQKNKHNEERHSCGKRHTASRADGCTVPAAELAALEEKQQKSF